MSTNGILSSVSSCVMFFLQKQKKDDEMAIDPGSGTERMRETLVATVSFAD